MSMTDVIVERLRSRGPLGRAVNSVRRKYGYADPPLAVSFLLTERCNLSCHMCPHGEGTVAQPGPMTNGGMIDLGLVKKLLDEVAQHRPEIGIMGGEPTLHPDCLEIIREARNRDLQTNLVTNGTLLKKLAEGLVESGVNAINLSLDGPPDVHNQVRGQRSSYERAVEGIRACREAARRGLGPEPEVHIFCVIQPDNHANLIDFLEDLVPLKPTHVQLNHLRFFTPTEVAEHSRVFEEHFGTPNDEPAGYQKELAEVDVDATVLRQQLRGAIDRQWPFQLLINPAHDVSELEAYYNTSLYERTELRTCHAVWTYACVGPTGEVYPCLKHVCGNLTEQPFLSIWNGPRWRKFRRELSRIERLPACHRCCF